VGALVGVWRRAGQGDHPVRDREPTYRAADIVYLVDKLERGFDRAIYVLGADHHGTRNWYAAIARMLGYDPERVEVLLYQLVHLTKGGEQAKMSKRRGDVVFLDEFMDEIGVDAARWYLVNRSPEQSIEIDVDLAAERSEKNPVYYVQYAHARIAGILRNAGDAEASVEPAAPLAPRSAT
jgi:arginyl-tRNA synthetase